MATRLQWAELEEQVEEYIDISEVTKSVFKFMNKINSRRRTQKKILSNILEAKRHFESALIMLKGIINPYNNTYLTEQEEHVKTLLDELGRWNKKLDDFEEKIISIVDKSEDFSSKDYSFLKLKSLGEQLREGEQMLLYIPINETVKEMKKIEFKETVDKTDFFGWLLFWQILNSSEILGIITREQRFSKTKFPQDVDSKTIETKERQITNKKEEEKPSEEEITYYSSEPSILSEDENED